MVFKLRSMKPNPSPISIWPSSNTGNELVRAIVVEPEPSKNRPSVSRYFGCVEHETSFLKRHWQPLKKAEDGAASERRQRTAEAMRGSPASQGVRSTRG